MLFRIALRNVLKNRRRSLITIFAVAFGFMAVTVFRGYTNNAFEKMTYGAVFREASGHLVVFKSGYARGSLLDPSAYMFSGEEIRQITSAISQLSSVIWVAPKLSLSGLITNGEVSTVFLSDAMAPDMERLLWSHFDYAGGQMAQPLPSEPAASAVLSNKLAALLGLNTGDTAVLMATTRFNQMNAIDVTVAGTEQALAEALDDKYLRISLSAARELYDFDGADRICTLLSSRNQTETLRKQILDVLDNLGISVEVKSWDELSEYYRKAKGFLDVVFLFIFSIVMIIVVMGTFNTMSMSVLERIRELGTLRAIGLRPTHVVKLIAIEGGLLGLSGSGVGMILTGVAFLFLRLANLTYKPPGIEEDIAIEIDLVPDVLVGTLLFFVALAVASAALPARRAARQNIVDALGHV